MNDLVILSNIINQKIERLQIVLGKCADHGLSIRWKNYLGYRVEHNKLNPSPFKLAAVQNYSKPKTIRHIQRFLSLTGYFQKFIKDYAIIARTISELLIKDAKYVFGTEQETVISMLKQKLTETPLLAIFNLEADKEVHTNATMYGFRAILMQKDNTSSSTL